MLKRSNVVTNVSDHRLPVETSSTSRRDYEKIVKYLKNNETETCNPIIVHPRETKSNRIRKKRRISQELSRRYSDIKTLQQVKAQGARNQHGVVEKFQRVRCGVSSDGPGLAWRVRAHSCRRQTGLLVVGA